MNELLARVTDAEEGYIIGPIGLTIVRALTQPEWTSLGQTIRRRAEGYQWALGDWLVYGGREIEGRGTRWLGSGYAIARQVTGYSVGHLSTAFRVSTVFPPEVREPAIVWTLYERVSTQPEHVRAELLREAKQQQWSTRDLEDYVAAKARDATRPVTGAATRTDAAPPTVRSLVRPLTLMQAKCPNCAHVFPVKPNRVVVVER